MDLVRRSIAAALEYMRHEQDRDPRGSFSSAPRVMDGGGAGWTSAWSDAAAAETSSGPSLSVASLSTGSLSSGTGTGTSMSDDEGKIVHIGEHGR
jgi:hypothetical protein